ncbi:ROK family transcriptional regulator [Thalassobacillus pellis]|uniref:ROK family transcriptional regulator n=1 Tax=Thalassobacillus pellis TaxID=748008 RepID=UPI0019603494|nr:ROK family transcriptional regulator [Thalassobacillus pellis]MBM7551467.1 glucokinase-like ROK family protein [Thalassobacillus pellis]
MQVKGSFQLMKSLNRSVILNKIRTDGPISRAELAKSTKLTPPTVSSIVKELLETGMIMESSQGASKGGRKPTMLVINASNFYIIGLDVGPTLLKSVLTDLNGTLVHQHEIPIPLPTSNQELLELMRDAVQNLLDTEEKEQDKIIGIGVGMHGVVDVQEGVSLFAPNLQLRDVPIKSYLEEVFHIHVVVENDARAMALGELWFGHGNGANNIVTVNLGRGIGAGIIINGELFHGENSIAGEIGHMTIDIRGPKCSCGNYGCLQTLASGPAISERAAKEIAIGKQSLLQEMVDDNLEEIGGRLIHEAAKKGDQLSIDILSEAGMFLGIGLTNLIHTLNPTRIIIGGGVSQAGEFILDSIKTAIQKRGLTNSAKNTEVLLSELGAHATALGAVSLILVEMFSVAKTE